MINLNPFEVEVRDLKSSAGNYAPLGAVNACGVEAVHAAGHCIAWMTLGLHWDTISSSGRELCRLPSEVCLMNRTSRGGDSVLMAAGVAAEVHMAHLEVWEMGSEHFEVGEVWHASRVALRATATVDRTELVVSRQIAREAGAEWLSPGGTLDEALATVGVHSLSLQRLADAIFDAGDASLGYEECFKVIGGSLREDEDVRDEWGIQVPSCNF